MSVTVWFIVIASGIVTYLERVAFLAVADRAGKVPPRVREALRMIPAAALAALVAPAVLRAGADGGIDLLDPRIPAALIALAVMYKTRQVLLTLVVGLGVLIALQQLLG